MSRNSRSPSACYDELWDWLEREYDETARCRKVDEVSDGPRSAYVMFDGGRLEQIERVRHFIEGRLK